MKYKEFKQFLANNEDQLTYVPDGIYDVTGINFIRDNSKNYGQIVEWIKRLDFKVWVASAYETDTYIFLDEEPRQFDYKFSGSGFNYGSTSIIRNCPDSILILAEND